MENLKLEKGAGFKFPSFASLRRTGRFQASLSPVIPPPPLLICSHTNSIKKEIEHFARMMRWFY